MSMIERVSKAFLDAVNGMTADRRPSGPGRLIVAKPPCSAPAHVFLSTSRSEQWRS